MVKKREALFGLSNKVFVVIGLSFIWEAFPYNFFAALESNFYNETTLERFGFYLFFVFCTTVFLAGFIGIGKFFDGVLRRRPIFSCGAGILLTVCFAILFFGSEADLGMPAVYGILSAASLATCYLLLSWGSLISGLSRREAHTLLLMSFALCSLEKLVESFSGAGFITPNVFIAPAVSGLMFFIVACRQTKVPAIASNATNLLLGSIPWKQLLLVALFVYAVEPVMALQTPSDLGMFDSATKPLVGIIGLFLSMVLLLFEYKEKTRFSDDRWWILAGIILIIVYAIVIFFSNPNQNLGMASMVAFRKFLAVLCWVLISDIVICNKMSPVIIFSAGIILLSTFPYLLRLLCTIAFAALPTSGFLTADKAAVICLVVVATVMILVSGRNGSLLLDSTTGAASSASDSWAKACMDIGAEHSLTSREQQVFALLAKGHTLSSIAGELCITINTVRSHSKHIYQKLGISTKQELIDMVETFKI